MSFLPQPAGLISMFNMGPLRINRPGQPTLNAYGAHVPAAPSEQVLNPVHVQTVDGRELEAEPGLDAHKETICLLTRVRMYVSDDGETADQVEYADRCYRVAKASNWDPHGGFYITFAQLEDGPFPEEYC